MRGEMLLRFVVVVNGQIVKRPLSQSVYVGDEALFQCSPKNGLAPDWFFKRATSTDDDEPLLVSSEGSGHTDFGNKYSVASFIKRPGHLAEQKEFNLVIHDVTLSDAGEYTCVDILFNNNASATLTVLKHPVKGNDTVVVSAG